jgi:hypothetical protein
MRCMVRMVLAVSMTASAIAACSPKGSPAERPDDPTEALRQDPCGQRSFQAPIAGRSSADDAGSARPWAEDPLCAGGPRAPRESAP